MPPVDVGQLVAEIARKRELGFNARAMQTIGKKPTFSLGDLVKQRVDLGDEPWTRFPNLPKKSGGGTSEEDTTPFQTIEAQMLKAGETSSEIAKAVRSLEESRDRAQSGKTPGKGIWERAKGALDDAVETGAQGLTSALDILSRPMYGTTAATKGLLFGSRDEDEAGLRAMFTGLAEGLSGKDREGGYGILDEAGWDTTDKSSWGNRLAHGTTGLGIEIAADPLSWMSLGTTGAAKDVATKLTESGVQAGLAKQVAKRAQRLTRTAKTGAARGTKKFSQGEVTDLISHGINTQRTRALNQYARAQTGNYRSFMKDAYDNAIAAGRTADEAELAAQLALNNETEALRNALTTGLGESGIGNKAFQLRLGFMGKGQDVLEGTKIGQRLYRPFEWTGEQLGKTGVGDMLGNAFKYEKLFPGRAAEIRHTMTASGVQRQKELNTWVKRNFRNMDLATRKEMVHNIENGIVPTGADRAGRSLAEIQEEVVAKLRQMAQEEVDNGIRLPEEVLQDGYVPHMYKGYKANQAAKKAPAGGVSFKDARKAQIRDAQNITGYRLQDAIDAGLDPETDIAKIMLAKGGKQNSALTRNGFNTNVLLTYGQPYKGLVRDADRIGIEKVPDNLIPRNVREMLGENEHWYMPKEYVRTLKEYDKLARGATDEHTKAFFRYLDNVNRWFKYSKTITKPAYHMNNMMSDVTFNWLDNVPVWEQGDVLRRWAATKAGRSGGTWKLGRREISWDEMRHLFDTHAGGSNFFDTDLPFRVRGGQGLNKARSAGARTNQILHGLSTKREDFPRFTHFQRAVRDEYKARAGKRLLNEAQHRKILQDAVDAAAARVNKFNIDYSALTPFEQKVMKRVIPFYTYMRKATPLLVESMAMNPGRILAIDKGRRAIEDTLGIEHNDAFDAVRIPEFLRDNHAYLQLNNKQNPSYLSLDALPTNLLASRFGDSTVQGLAREGAAMSNLGIRGLYEIAHGGTFFNNTKPDTIADYLLRELSPVEQYMPLGGSKTSANALKKYLGIPNAQISEEQQLQAIKQSADPYQQKNAELSKMLEEKGYDFSKVTTKKKGTKWRIIDRMTGQLVGEFDSPGEAQAAANNL